MQTEAAAVSNGERIMKPGRMRKRFNHVDWSIHFIFIVCLKISEGKEILNVLLVGNSFTYAGNLDQVSHLRGISSDNLIYLLRYDFRSFTSRRLRTKHRPCVRQVLAGLLDAAGTKSHVTRYAEPNYNFANHVSDAYDKGKRLYSLLGDGGSDKYDFVIFQVRLTA